MIKIAKLPNNWKIGNTFIPGTRRYVNNIGGVDYDILIYPPSYSAIKGEKNKKKYNVFLSVYKDFPKTIARKSFTTSAAATKQAHEWMRKYPKPKR